MVTPKNVINWVISLGIIAGLVYFFAPGLWFKGEKFYNAKMGWNAEARKADPVGFLKFTKESLTAALGNIESNLKDLDVQASRLRKELNKTRSDQGQYLEAQYGFQGAGH